MPIQDVCWFVACQEMCPLQHTNYLFALLKFPARCLPSFPVRLGSIAKTIRFWPYAGRMLSIYVSKVVVDHCILHSFDIVFVFSFAPGGLVDIATLQ